MTVGPGVNSQGLLSRQRRSSLLPANAEFQDVYDFMFHRPAMRDLRIYGKNRLLGLFRAWLKKQTGVKARAGRSSTCRHITKVNRIPICGRRTDRKTTPNGEP